RYDRHAFAFDRTHEAIDLPLLQQQFACPLGRVVEAARLQVFRDIRIDQPELAGACIGVGFRNRRFSGAQRFHLAAGQHHPRLEGFPNRVIEARLAVVGDHLEAPLGFCSHGTSVAIVFVQGALSSSRISVSSSSVFVSGGGLSSSSFFCLYVSRFVPRSTRNRISAMMRKLMVTVRKLPYPRTAPCFFASTSVSAVTFEESGKK